MTDTTAKILEGCAGREVPGKGRMAQRLRRAVRKRSGDAEEASGKNFIDTKVTQGRQWKEPPAWPESIPGNVMVETTCQMYITDSLNQTVFRS